MTEIILAVDLGTGGPKVALVRLDGEVLAHELTPIETTFLPGGGAVQNVDDWWQAIADSTRRLMDLKVADPKDIVGINCTGQWGSSIPIGEDNKAIGPCILWMDARGHQYSQEILGGVGPIEIEGYGINKAFKFIQKSGGAPALAGNDPLGHYLYLKNEEPELFKQTRKILEPVDYLSLKFSGEVKASPASMILSWLVDIRDLKNPKYAPDLISLLNRDPSKLPDLVPIGSKVGLILDSVADDLGIPRSIPVVTGLPDLLSACTGSGGLEDFEMHMAISTTSWLSCHVPFKKTDPFRQIATVPGVMKGKYMLANNHDTAGICLQWLKDSLYKPISKLSSEVSGPNGKVRGKSDNMTRDQDEIGYQDLDLIAKNSKPGSGGVIFTPWLQGERCPVDDRTLRGSFLNISLNTTREDMTRALFEGVALNARWMMDAVEHFIKRKTGPIRFIGGGAVSDVWCQIHADVMNREVRQVSKPLLANVRGAALFAGISLGKISSSDVAKDVKIGKTFVPTDENLKVYDELYGEFKKVYKAQKNMYKRLNRHGGPFDDKESQ